MKFTLRATLLLVSSCAFAACGSDSKPGNGGEHGGVGGNAGGAGGNAGGASVGGNPGRGGVGGSAGEVSFSGAAGNPAPGDGGASDGGAGGGDVGPLAPLARAFCRAARSCCASGDALDQCEQTFSSEMDAVALLAGGRVRMNQTAMLGCIGAYERAESSCALSEVRVACHGLLTGTVADGGSCTSVLECDRSQAAKVCLRLADKATGSCLSAPRGTEGTACARSCARGEDCSTTNFAPDTSVPTALCHEEDGLYCPIGESCARLVAQGQDCTWNEACGSGGFCVSTCDIRGQLGAPCQFNYGCVEGLFCSAGKCAPEPFATDEVCSGIPPVLD